MPTRMPNPIRTVPPLAERRVWTVRWGIWTTALAVAALTWSTLAMEVPVHGWTGGFGLLAGTLSYAFMAIAVVLATRRPILERWFGPLDRLYRAHRMLGIGTIAGLGLHLLLRNDPYGSRIIDLAADLVFRPLGVAGAVLLALSVVLAVVVKVPYHRWKPIHLATMVTFAVLTAHAVLAAGALNPTKAYSVSVGVFAVAGTISIVVRLVDRAKRGIPYTVVGRVRAGRALEVSLAPLGRRMMEPAHAGQFAFVTARAGGRREAHPFTLTSPGADAQPSIAIRALGDWTAAAQDDVQIGDEVRLEGPFGAFTPLALREATHRPHVWLGAGAGITPFVSAVRSAASATRANLGEHAEAPRAELVVVARDAADVPCWDALIRDAAHVPWLRMTTAFSADGDRLDIEAIDRLIARTPEDAEWFLCGPSGLTALVAARVRRAQGPRSTVHREVFDWRGARMVPWRLRRGAPSRR